jgi:outer membrane protein
MTATIVALALAAQVLTLDQAVQIAERQAPQLRQSASQTEAARARALQARAPLLPQVNGSASYQRATGNYASRPGALPNSQGFQVPSPSFDTFNYFSFGLQATLLLYDFGQTTGKWHAAEASAEAQKETAQATRLQVILSVRTAYFNARAQKALVGVAREQLVNQERHLSQIEGFVKVGTRPEIDLAQARTDRANARVQLIGAENASTVARALLNQAMGVEGTTDYEVADEALPAVPGEDQPPEAHMAEALRARPEFLSLEQQIRSQEMTLRSIRGSRWPSIGVSTGFTDAGSQIDNLAWNWSATASLSWPLYQGGLTKAQVSEASATLAGLAAQRDLVRQQVRVEVEQARLGVRAAKAGLGAADEALENARVRLQLAEGRYQTGVGNVIELGDAQVALTNAAAQKVQSEYNLATARSQLLKALGRR